MLARYIVILALLPLSSSADDPCPPFPDYVIGRRGCLCGTGQTRCEELEVCDPTGNGGQGKCTPSCPNTPAQEECQCAEVRCNKGERCDPDYYYHGFCRSQCPKGNQTASERCYCGSEEFCDAGSVCYSEDIGECFEQCPPHRQAKWECQCASKRCGEGEICDPNGNGGEGKYAEHELPPSYLTNRSTANFAVRGNRSFFCRCERHFF